MEDLVCFLTVSWEEPMVKLIHSLAPFNVSFGTTNRFHGLIFAREGDFIDGQMPRIIQMPAPNTGEVLFETSELPVVVVETLQQY